MNKRGPKTEPPVTTMQRKVFTIDPLALRMLKALAEATTEGNESLALRKAIRLAYDRYQRTA